MPPAQIVSVRLDQRLRDSTKTATSMSLPAAVHYRLDLLAEKAGNMNPSRAELVAMLIAEAELDEDSLEQRLLAYRKMTVGQILSQDEAPAAERSEGGKVINLPLRAPGRPRHAAGGSGG
jgi:hypothetical protein